MNPRLIATLALDEVFRQRASLTQSLAQHLPRAESPQQRALAQELCFGVMRWWPRLDTLLQRLLRKPLKPKDTDIYVLLLVGLYQLGFTRVPDHAAVSETVAAVNKLKKVWARNLVNAVLRGFQRQRVQLEQDLAHDDIYQTAHPAWLLALIQSAWPQDWQAIVAANNERPPLTLRVNALQGHTAAYLQQLQEQQLPAQAQRYAATAITLQHACDVQQLPGFDQGRVSVQDQAAQLAAGLLELQPGQRVLDVCAAPGGKTAHILETQPDLAQLVAVDVDAHRLQRVQENLARLQLSATVLCGDALQPSQWWDGQGFDRILLDAPCSASGVIRRHPDIKWLRQPADIDALVVQQHQILDAVWPLLKSGGMLLYATCSILPQENNSQIQAFLQRRPDARLRHINGAWGREMDAGRQILPGDDNMDGFYYALLEKTS